MQPVGSVGGRRVTFPSAEVAFFESREEGGTTTVLRGGDSTRPNSGDAAINAFSHRLLLLHGGLWQPPPPDDDGSFSQSVVGVCTNQPESPLPPFSLDREGWRRRRDFLFVI